jgi:hypothetical protein
MRKVVAFAWPMRRLTAGTSMPLAISADAWLWRRAWKLTRGSLRVCTNRHQSRLRLLGGIGPSSMAVLHVHHAVEHRRGPIPSLRLGAHETDKPVANLPALQGSGDVTEKRVAVDNGQWFGRAHDGAQLLVGKGDRGHRREISARVSAGGQGRDHRPWRRGAEFDLVDNYVNITAGSPNALLNLQIRCKRSLQFL